MGRHFATAEEEFADWVERSKDAPDVKAAKAKEKAELEAGLEREHYPQNMVQGTPLDNAIRRVRMATKREKMPDLADMLFIKKNKGKLSKKVQERLNALQEQYNQATSSTPPDTTVSEAEQSEDEQQEDEQPEDEQPEDEQPESESEQPIPVPKKKKKVTLKPESKKESEQPKKKTIRKPISENDVEQPISKAKEKVVQTMAERTPQKPATTGRQTSEGATTNQSAKVNIGQKRAAASEPTSASKKRLIDNLNFEEVDDNEKDPVVDDNDIAPTLKRRVFSLERQMINNSLLYERTIAELETKSNQCKDLANALRNICNATDEKLFKGSTAVAVRRIHEATKEVLGEVAEDDGEAEDLIKGYKNSLMLWDGYSDWSAKA